MFEDSIVAKLVKQDFGLEIQGKRWGRAEDHDSLIVDMERDLFFWNSEGINGDAYIYLTKVRKLSPKEAKEFLAHNAFTGTFIEEMKDGETHTVYPKLVDVFHEAIWNEDRTYFHNRTITDETIARFKLGFHNNFYTIPIYDNGVFKQFQMRRDSPKLIKNYYKHVGPLLFNSDILKITNKIYFTEGLMGAIVLMQNGIPAISMNIGSEGFEPSWVSKFIHQKEVYILFDHDSAGLKGAIRTAKIIGQYKCKIYTFDDFDGKGFAVDDAFIEGITKEDFITLVETKSKYAFELESGNERNSFNSGYGNFSRR